MARGGNPNSQSRLANQYPPALDQRHRASGISGVRSQDKPSEALIERMRAAKSVVVITGAGISTESGLPDFRSKGTGVWEKHDPAAVGSGSGFAQNPDLIWQLYVDDLMAADVQPNSGHQALCDLKQQGLVTSIITQNVDGLHQASGFDEADVLEIHGNVRNAECHSCGLTLPLSEVKRLARQAPACPKCTSPMQPSIVLFGQQPRGHERARELVRNADVVMAVGTSLQVEPVASLPRYARRHRAFVSIVTAGATPYDDKRWWRDERVIAQCGSWLSALAKSF